MLLFLFQGMSWNEPEKTQKLEGNIKPVGYLFIGVIPFLIPYVLHQQVGAGILCFGIFARKGAMWVWVKNRYLEWEPWQMEAKAETCGPNGASILIHAPVRSVTSNLCLGSTTPLTHFSPSKRATSRGPSKRGRAAHASFFSAHRLSWAWAGEKSPQMQKKPHGRPAPIG